MAESDTHRVVSREEADGTRLIVCVRRDPETDAMADDELIDQWQQAIRDHNEKQGGAA